MKKLLSTVCCSAILALSSFATELPTIKPQQIADISDVKWGDIAPDGSKVAVYYGQKLRIINLLSSGASESFTKTYDDYLSGVQFSPDSSKLSLNLEGLEIISSDGTSIASSNKSSSEYSTVWSADSSKTYHISDGNSDYIVTTDVDTNASTLTSMSDSFWSSSNYKDKTYSPNLEYIASSYRREYSFNTSFIKIYQLSSGNEYKTYPLYEWNYVYNIKLIDNSTIAYTYRYELDNDVDGEADQYGETSGDGVDYKLVLRDIDTGSITSIGAFDGTHDKQLWHEYINGSPYIVVQEDDTSNYQLYDIRTNEYVAKVDLGDMVASDEKILSSEDGKKLAIIDSSNNMRVFDISAISSADSFKIAPVISNINTTLTDRDTLNITFDVASE
jgi:hypothetical protein